MGKLTTHVLDTASGKPGAGIAVRLYRLDGDARELVVETRTNADGRTDTPLLANTAWKAGRYELEFGVGDYFAGRGNVSDEPPFLDDVVLRVGLAGDAHYHVPLLVSPWSYSTYRGS